MICLENFDIQCTGRNLLVEDRLGNEGAVIFTDTGTRLLTPRFTA